MTDRHTASSITDDALTALYDQLDQARDIAVALENENAAATAEQERLRARLGAALACVRLLKIYADGLDHGRRVDASDVARRIRRILTGLDERPVGDPEPQRQLAAAMVTAAAEAIEDYCLTHLGRDLGTIHLADIARAGLQAAQATAEGSST